jgi:hypothetical protein
MTVTAIVRQWQTATWFVWWLEEYSEINRLGVRTYIYAATPFSDRAHPVTPQGLAPDFRHVRWQCRSAADLGLWARP